MFTMFHLNQRNIIRRILHLKILLIVLYVPSMMALPITGKARQQFSKFDHQLMKIMHAWKIPGAELAVMKKGNLIYNRGYGWAHIKKKIKVKPDSLFRIASISKTITAITINKLVNEHKLSLNNRVFSILHDLHPFPGMRLNREINQVSVYDLLIMSSGWKGEGAHTIEPVFGKIPKRYLKTVPVTSPVGCQYAARFVMGRKFDFKPGTQFAYANVNYCMLGLIINKVNHLPYGYKPYEHFIQTTILKPLGITDMFIGSNLLQERHPKEVFYYPFSFRRNRYHHIYFLRDLPYGNDHVLQKSYAAGGWVATAKDLVELVQALQDNTLFQHALLKKMLKKPSGIDYTDFQKDTQKYKKYYAMGWFIQEVNGNQVWYTHGSFTGTNAMLVRRWDGVVFSIIFNKKPHGMKNLIRLREQVEELILHQVV